MHMHMRMVQQPARDVQSHSSSSSSSSIYVAHLMSTRGKSVV